MRFITRTSHDGVTERLFTLGETPGVLMTPEGAVGARPLIVLGHGGGQHKTAPGVVAHARHFVTAGGFAAVAMDAPNHGDREKDDRFTSLATKMRARLAAGEDATEALATLHAFLAEQAVPEWRAVVTAVRELDDVGDGPVGYWGVSMGSGLGIPFVAQDSRVRAAVFGLAGSCGLADIASRITVPVRFLTQWHDRWVPRDASLALFDAFASTAKSMHVNSGDHMDVPRYEKDESLRFLTRHLG